MSINIPDAEHQFNSFPLSVSRQQIAWVDTSQGRTPAMSAHLSPAPITRGLIPAAPHLTLALRLAWRRFRRAYDQALREETSRRNLHRLDDHMLSDIGITRAQAQFEADRRPWHAI
jgi:uncharacterized protein YjiS (DUF1127 family)